MPDKDGRAAFADLPDSEWSSLARRWSVVSTALVGVGMGGAFIGDKLHVTDALETLLATVIVRAAHGRVDEAEQALDEVTPQDLENDAIRAQYTRTRALVLYRRELFRDLVDLANAESPPLLARDRALLDALARSSLLRLEVDAAPMRLAAAPEHDEWVDRVVPELRARG